MNASGGSSSESPPEPKQRRSSLIKIGAALLAASVVVLAAIEYLPTLSDAEGAPTAGGTLLPSPEADEIPPVSDLPEESTTPDTPAIEPSLQPNQSGSDAPVAQQPPGNGATIPDPADAVDPVLPRGSSPVIRGAIAGPSVQTYTVGIPVGAGKGLINPVELNAWAQEIGLTQTWQIEEGSSIAATYSGAVLPNDNAAVVQKSGRSPQELAEVIKTFRNLNTIPDVREMQPGSYVGPFLFGAKDVSPESPFSDPEGDLNRPAQITLSVLDTALRRFPRGPACPASVSFEQLINDQALKDQGTKLRVVKPLRDPLRPALQFIQFTEEQWKSFSNRFPNARLEAGSFPLPIDLAAMNRFRDTKQYKLADDEASALREVLALPRRKKPVLVVFDDSWPVNDPAAFQRSIKFFCSALDELWSTEKERYRQLNEPCTAAMLAAKVPEKPKGFECNAGVDCRTHSQKIRDALSTYTQIAGDDSESPVNVVYLPFNGAQEYAVEILSRLVRWHGMDQPTRVDPSIAISKPEALAVYREMAAAAIQGLPTELKPAQRITASNMLLYNALLSFTTRYSRLRREPIFLNVSWTTTTTNITLRQTYDSFNIVFAAAGNNCDPDLAGPGRCTEDYHAREDFQRFFVESDPPGNYVAVMNTDLAGRAVCNSTLLRGTELAMATPGAIAGDCGTSFSSPRAAWLYALYDSRIDKPPGMGAAFSEGAPRDWARGVREAIGRATSCHGDLLGDYSCLQFGLGKILSLIKTAESEK